MRAPETFETDRLILRPVVREDAADIFAYAGAKAPTRFMPFKRHESIDDSLAFAIRCADAWQSGAAFPWAMTRNDTGQFIGVIELRLSPPKADFGYILNEAFWGQGYTSEAASAVVKWAIQQPDIHRIWATCHPDNAASAAVLRKAGLSFEADLPKWENRPQLNEAAGRSLLYARMKALPNQGVKSSYLRTDECKDIASSVKHALWCMDKVHYHPSEWKWFTLAIHSALQGALVSHLTTTATPIGAINNKCAAEWLTHFNGEGPPPKKTQLLNFPELLKKARKPGTCGGGPTMVSIQISDIELGWLSRFHENVRNQFTHFEPMGWSLEISGLQPLGALVARIIEAVIDAGWAFRHEDYDWVADLRNDLRRLATVRD
ncbi:GNAT family N-acetyltransferase [Brevundimonas sp.]|uniref:GNAT family N-acetyltransferase n=1 Tax=Brevundimonas sp. TaxID=1871086 RepID=UPI002898D3ED|nr:GNAT family N-acetyltransferase [Brevundimonas sp.]